MKLLKDALILLNKLKAFEIKRMRSWGGAEGGGGFPAMLRMCQCGQTSHLPVTLHSHVNIIIIGILSIVDNIINLHLSSRISSHFQSPTKSSTVLRGGDVVAHLDANRALHMLQCIQADLPYVYMHADLGPGETLMCVDAGS